MTKMVCHMKLVPHFLKVQYDKQYDYNSSLDAHLFNI